MGTVLMYGPHLCNAVLHKISLFTITISEELEEIKKGTAVPFYYFLSPNISSDCSRILYFRILPAAFIGNSLTNTK